MAFTDFTLETVEEELGVTARPGAVFPALPEASVPTWLIDGLARGMELALVSEKARSEFIVAPMLLGVRELSGGRISILSGQRLDVDPGAACWENATSFWPFPNRCPVCVPRW